MSRLAAPPARLLRGHLDAFYADKIGFLSACARDYGDVVPLRMGPMRLWILSDPNLIGEVFGAKADAFQKDVGLRRVKVILGEGLLTSEGAAHARRSKLAQPAFRRQEIEKYASDMVRLTRARAARWVAAERPVDLGEELSALALSIVAHSLFGAELAEGVEPIGHALTELLELLEGRMGALVPIPLWVPTPSNRRFRAALGVLDDAVYEIIRARRAQLARGGEAPDDLLGRLLRAGGEPGGERPLSDRELRDEVMTLILAGHETTANGMAFAQWLLATHPEVLADVRAEVDAVLGDRPATAADVPRLERVGQVFQEALRLYPPAWMLGRQCARDVDLGGGRVQVRRGDMIGVVSYVVHRDPRWWDEPDAFRPERFARGAARPAPHTYIPFGLGKRACIGRSFALLEGTLVLATLAQQVDLRLDTERELELVTQLTLRPGSLPVTARARTRAGVAVAV